MLLINMAHRPVKLTAGKLIELSFICFGSVSIIHYHCEEMYGKTCPEINNVTFVILCFIGSENFNGVSKLASNCCLMRTKESTSCSHNTSSKKLIFNSLRERRKIAEYVKREISFKLKIYTRLMKYKIYQSHQTNDRIILN